MTAAGHRSEAGQTTAFVCAMLFTLTMFVALVVNVGQMVNRRVALQVVADAGAWSGATVQAIQLNHYAFWSRMVQNAYQYASAVSFRFNFGECGSGATAVAANLWAQSGMLRAVRSFGGAAYGEAERHSYFNIDDLFPGERRNFGFSTMAGPDAGMVGALAQGNIPPFPLRSGERLYTGTHAWSRETAAQMGLELVWRLTSWMPWRSRSAGSPAGESWTCVNIIPPFTARLAIFGPSGYKLQRLGLPYLFVWRVTERRATRVLFFDRFFGPNAVPPMTAVAVAKAVGGDVHRGLSRYRAKMIPVGRYGLPPGGFITDPAARRGRFLPGSIRRIVH